MQERNAYPEIWRAKVEADEYLVAMSHIRNQELRKDGRGGAFQNISLRPSWLMNGKGGKGVSLGKTRALGQVDRIDVAETAVELLGRSDTKGWFDLLQGKEDIEGAVERVVKDEVDTIEGEDDESIIM